MGESEDVNCRSPPWGTGSHHCIGLSARVGDSESDTVLPPAAPCQIAPSDERVSSRIPVSHTVRRSSRVNRGIHSNPAHLPMPGH